MGSGDKIDWGTALLVGNRARMSGEYRQALETRFSKVVAASSMGNAFELLTESDPIAFALVDIDSVQGAVWVAIAASKRVPTPLVFAFHEEPLSADDAFSLGRWGVDRLLPGPLTGEKILEELQAARDAPLPDVAHVIAPYVGRVGLLDFEASARQAFIDQAINRCLANRSEAARLLRVPRPIVQRGVRPSTSAD